jgi:hypothetical protein
VIDDLLVWNGRAADPAPSKREAFVGADKAATKAVDIRETLDELAALDPVVDERRVLRLADAEVLELR